MEWRFRLSWFGNGSGQFLACKSVGSRCFGSGRVSIDVHAAVWWCIKALLLFCWPSSLVMSWNAWRGEPNQWGQQSGVVFWTVELKHPINVPFRSVHCRNKGVPTFTFLVGEGVYIIASMLRFRTSEGLWWVWGPCCHIYWPYRHPTGQIYCAFSCNKPLKDN